MKEIKKGTNSDMEPNLKIYNEKKWKDKKRTIITRKYLRIILTKSTQTMQR